MTVFRWFARLMGWATWEDIDLGDDRVRDLESNPFTRKVKKGPSHKRKIERHRKHHRHHRHHAPPSAPKVFAVVVNP